MMSSALLALSLAISAPALAGPAEPGHDPQSAALRRTLVSVLVLKKLDLSAEQKRALQGVITDAKALRSQVTADPGLEKVKSDRQALLEKAIEEARATGSVSAETRASLMGLRESGRERQVAFSARRKEIGQRLKAIFTPDQVQALQSLRGEIAPERERMGREEKGPAVPEEGEKREGRGKGLFLRLLMSDEFAAELAR